MKRRLFYEISVPWRGPTHMLYKVARKVRPQFWLLRSSLKHYNRFACILLTINNKTDVINYLLTYFLHHTISLCFLRCVNQSGFIFLLPPCNFSLWIFKQPLSVLTLSYLQQGSCHISHCTNTQDQQQQILPTYLTQCQS